MRFTLFCTHMPCNGLVECMLTEGMRTILIMDDLPIFEDRMSEDTKMALI